MPADEKGSGVFSPGAVSLKASARENRRHTPFRDLSPSVATINGSVEATKRFIMAPTKPIIPQRRAYRRAPGPFEGGWHGVSGNHAGRIYNLSASGYFIEWPS